MGHSAGAHLVMLLSSSPPLSAGIVTTPWLGTVALDRAARDVERIMRPRHARLYDRAFGSDPAYWRGVSPYHLLKVAACPILAVCSSRRPDSSEQARRFVAKAEALGNRATVLEENFTHRDI